MSELIKSGLFGMGDKTKEETILNWTTTNLLDGIKDKTLKDKVALTLEDAANIMVNAVDYTPYCGQFDMMIFPIIRRVICSIHSGEFHYMMISGDYENSKAGLVDLLTADFIVKETVKIYTPTLEFFKNIYSDEVEIDFEAEACAFISKTISQMYLREFRGKNIVKVGDNYITVNTGLGN